MVIARQPFCCKLISVTKVSKYGKSEYSQASNASYMFQPLMSFCWYFIFTFTWTTWKTTFFSQKRQRAQAIPLHFNHLIDKNIRGIWRCSLTNNNKHSIYARTVSCGRDFTKPRHFLQFLSNFLCADCPKAVVVHTDQKNNVMMVKFVLIFPVSRAQYFSKENYRIKTNRHIFFMFYSLKKSIGMTSKKLKTQVDTRHEPQPK